MRICMFVVGVSRMTRFVDCHCFTPPAYGQFHSPSHGVGARCGVWISRRQICLISSITAISASIATDVSALECRVKFAASTLTLEP